MRFCYWSSNVCSSSLLEPAGSWLVIHVALGRGLTREDRTRFGAGLPGRNQLRLRRGIGLLRVDQFDQRRFAGAVAELGEPDAFARLLDPAALARPIGRASCRERVCPSV